MIPVQLNYAVPEDLASAVKLLAEHKDAQILAGGNSLLTAIKLGHIAPSMLIDLTRISELQGIQQRQNALCIGAMTTYAQTIAAPEIKTYHALAESVNSIGDAQIRNLGRMGDTFAYRDLACDLLAAFLVMEAAFNIVGPNGVWVIPVEQFLISPAQSNLESGEIVTAIQLPLLLNTTGSAYEAFKHPASQYTLCGVASKVEQSTDGLIHTCRVATTGTASLNRRLYQIETALEGASPSADNIAVLIEEAVDNIDFEQVLMQVEYATSDYLSPEYYVHLVKVLIERSLSRAVKRLLDR